MDKSLKNDSIQAYLDRQKVYVYSYSSEGTDLHHLSKISNRTPTRVRSEGAKKLEFGFDTPILVPRVTGSNVVSTDKRSVVGLPAKATQKAQKALDAETSMKENKGSLRAPLITAQRDPSKRKRKKADVLGSDEEREARLGERRERKRVKRDIVKPDTNIAAHNSPPASEKENKRVAQKRGKKHLGTAGLALLHGFSATNVGKNRLTLKPLASLGVFNKGKSSAKTKVCKAKQPAQKLFSEISFLDKTTKQHGSLVDESIVSESSPRSPSAVQKIEITNHEDKKSTHSTSHHSATTDLPRGSTATSEPWDIELQSKCPSSDGFCPQPGKPIAGTPVLDPRMASWHDQELSSEGQVIHPPLIKTPVKETSHDCMPDKILSPVPASVIATIYDLDGEPSIHPSHSASQVGLKRLDHSNPSVKLLTSKYFVVHDGHDTERVSPTFNQQHPMVNSSGAISDCNPHDANPFSVSNPHDTSTTRHATPLNAMVDSSPLRIHGIPEEHFLPFTDDLMPTYQGYPIAQCSRSNEDVISEWYAPVERTTNFFDGDSDYHNLRDQDLVFLDLPRLINEPSFYPPVEVSSSDGLHDISADDMVVLDESCEGPRKLIEYTPEMDDYDYEYSDLALERSSSHHGSFSSPTHSHMTADTYDDNSCSLRPFLQGRAMLLGIPPYVPPWHDPHHEDSKFTKSGGGLLSAEVDVAKRLKDHWRPHRL